MNRIAVLFMAAWLAYAGLAAAQVRSSFDLAVPMPPTPVAIGGAQRLVYELHVTNFARDPLTLTRVEVRDAERGAAVAEFAGDALAASIGRPGSPGGDARSIAPGMRAIVYFELALAPDAEIPKTLTHRIAAEASGSRERLVADGGDAAVDATPPVVLGPPLKGGPWAAVYDPKMERGHRRVEIALGGRARIPARFAIDWFKLDERGNLARDDEIVADWLGYGADVLAVADGTIVDVRDGIAERTRTDEKAPPNPLANASGNYVALDLGGGRYAFYEHLKPGSVRVKAGDRVRRGDVVGALGFTGDSTGPHLHFHVGNGRSPLASEGVPYVFVEYERRGAYASIEAFAKGGAWATSGARRVRGELPAPNDVVVFP